MTHDELSDLFAETYTVIKQQFLRDNNSVDFSGNLNNETFKFNIEEKETVLSKTTDTLSIFYNNNTIFSIPVLESPSKSVEIDDSAIEFLKKLNTFNSELKSSLNIKSYLDDKETLSKAVRVNKIKHKL